jgi:3-deoxy-D-manno-octulosonic-acid transferase
LETLNRILYIFALQVYVLGIRVASLFNPKAALWLKGRRGWKKKLQAELEGKSNARIWFHASSLGEFEQGRPVLERLRREYPDHCIVLTFFSPSGYEPRKKEALADIVMYMPMDGPRRSREFIDAIHPRMVFFVKYDFWYFYSRHLSSRRIPFFCLSAVFRPSQIYFKPWGDFYRRILLRFTHLFVQDQASLELLYRNSIANVTVAGDTRFDRVVQNSQRPADFPFLSAFAAQCSSIVAGSTWPADEEVLAEVVEAMPQLRLIVAPHETGEGRIRQILQRFGNKARTWSELENVSEPDAELRVIVIDRIGMLSLLYRFGQYAWVGGGFGSGIHNILEAAVYGKPVFFGPRFSKFTEAREMIGKGGAFSVKSARELIGRMQEIEVAADLYQSCCATNAAYIRSRTGATDIVINYLQLNHHLGSVK